MKKNSDFNVDSLLNDLFKHETLADLFNDRIKEFDISPRQALSILKIEHRALHGILYGTKKQVDTLNFVKLATFLNIPKEKVVRLYFEVLEKNFPDVSAYPQDKVDFINSYFDLASLKKAGFLDVITDYKEIERRLNIRFGLSSIFEYKEPSESVAFSSGVTKPKSSKTRSQWIKAAKDAFHEIGNPHDFQRKALLNYIPAIRKQCMDVNHGLFNVIHDLYQLGVTVYYQPNLPSLHLRGATMVINNKPCIVITDYVGFYATLWFALIHELYHVLFDLDDIENGTYHISDGDPEVLDQLSENEKSADHFAREYLFSREKSLKARPHIRNNTFVKQFALVNDVDPSLVYTFHAYDMGKDASKEWALAKRHNPKVDQLTDQLALRWTDLKSTKEHIDKLKDFNIYN